MKLNDIFPFWYSSGGIFNAMSKISQTPPIWLSDDRVFPLDLMYHGNISGGKTISPLISSLATVTPANFTSGDNELLSPLVVAVASVCINMFSSNWDKLWGTYIKTYNSLSTFSTTENTNVEEENTGTTGNTTNSRYDNSNDTNNATYGFNSDTQTPTDTSTDTTEGNTTSATTRTDNLKHTFSSDTDKQGYAGTTPQEMLIKERELLKQQFFNTLFSDLDSVLTIQVY